MKKILILALCFVFMTVLISCGAKDKETGKNDKDSVQEDQKQDDADQTAGDSESAGDDETEDNGQEDVQGDDDTEGDGIDAEDSEEEDPEDAEEPKGDDVAEEIDYTGKKLIALTFDDGPNTQITPKVLDKLEAHGAVATFFLIGSNINAATIPVMERQLEMGCEISNHSWSHSNMTTLTEEQIKDEIQKTNDKIFEAVGIIPEFFRPPFIAVNAVMYNNIELPFVNGINCNDWTGSVTAEQRAETILKNAKDGDIVLLHDFVGNTNTVDALDAIIEGLEEQGFAFVTVSKLFELKGVDPKVANKLWTNTGW